jgi:hypothetical protein
MKQAEALKFDREHPNVLLKVMINTVDKSDFGRYYLKLLESRILI